MRTQLEPTDSAVLTRPSRVLVRRPRLTAGLSISITSRQPVLSPARGRLLSTQSSPGGNSSPSGYSSVRAVRKSGWWSRQPRTTATPERTGNRGRRGSRVDFTNTPGKPRAASARFLLAGRGSRSPVTRYQGGRDADTTAPSCGADRPDTKIRPSSASSGFQQSHRFRPVP